MKPDDLESMSVDGLWSLHERVVSILMRKISAEKARLEQRLREITAPRANVSHARHPYPQVFPKYRNPTQPSETWAGRGKKPTLAERAAQVGQTDRRFSDRLLSGFRRGLWVDCCASLTWSRSLFNSRS